MVTKIYELNVLRQDMTALEKINIVVALGFGWGEFHRKGSTKPDMPYAIITRVTPAVRVKHKVPNTYNFPFKDVEKLLTFEFFKTKLMCIENSWICEMDS